MFGVLCFYVPVGGGGGGIAEELNKHLQSSFVGKRSQKWLPRQSRAKNTSLIDSQSDV